MADRILLAEDDRDLRVLLVEELEAAGYEVAAFGTATAVARELEAGGPADLVVTDLILPGMRGQELLRVVRAQRPEIAVVIITAFGSIDSAIELVKDGAYDYLTKPFSTDELLHTVARALQETRVRRETAALARAMPAPPPGFVGASKPMQELFRVIERAGRSASPVLITGESGTGKELVARGLHRVSGRRSFVAVNCSAFPENLLESELFGHEKGSFTSADRAKPGLFEEADRGTLFLDEVAELPMSLQPKLLRAIESGEVRRVGSTRPTKVDVRVLAATNRDLEAEVAAGRFREDLFWRLNVIHVHVPPLRERQADVPLLVEHFLGERRIAADAMALLTAYPWPGNVRELRNAIERAVALAEVEEIRAADLPERIRTAGRLGAIATDASRRRLPLRELEREYILEILRQTGGNKSRAAELLGLDRKTLYRKLDEYRAEQPDFTV